MREEVKHSTYRWLRLGCLALVLGCGGDDVDTGKVIEDIKGDGDGDATSMMGDGDAPTGDGDAPAGDGDAPVGDGDDDVDAGTEPGGDGDTETPDAGGGEPAHSEAYLRGKAIAETEMCADCHQEDYSGLGFFPNLTPDATGLKSWTDAQIAKAITQGVGNDGKTLCTGMPKFELSESEVADVIAFLRGQPAVKRVIKFVCPGHGK
ncbi:MAG: c-type cytochrome [Myxococcales bacterium]